MSVALNRYSNKMSTAVATPVSVDSHALKKEASGEAKDFELPNTPKGSKTKEGKQEEVKKPATPDINQKLAISLDAEGRNATDEQIKEVAETHVIYGPKQGVSIANVENIVGPLAKFLGTKKNVKKFKALRMEKHGDDSDNNSDNYLDTMTMGNLVAGLEEKKNITGNDGRVFENINETIKTKPSAFEVPENLEKLQSVVKKAYEKGTRIRVVGAGHSWTPVFPEDGSIMVSMESFQGISHNTNNSDDKSKWTVTFKVGTKIKQFDAYCKKIGVATPTSVVMDHVGFGGLVSMGCHGTGWKCKTISDECVGMKLVDGKGEVREFSAEKTGKTEWSALVTNLGVFGIVYEYTLRVVPDFNVTVLDYKTPSKNLFGVGSEAALRELVTHRHSTQIFWMPFTKDLWVKTFKKTSKPVNVPRIKVVMDTFSNWLSMNFGVDTVDIAATGSMLTPLFMKAAFATFPEHYERVESISDAIHWEDYLDRIKIMCMEFAFPLRKDNLEDWGNITKSVRYVQRRIDELARENKYPLNLALEMRFVSASDSLMSTTNGNEHSCFIEIVTSENAYYWKEFSAEVALEWMKVPGVRPHWAKMCHHVPGIVEHIQKEFGDRITTFNKVRKDMNVDPKNIFYTQWLANILEPEEFAPYVNSGQEKVNQGAITKPDPKKTDTKKPDQKKKSTGCF